MITSHHVAVFLLTFFVYSIFHAARKTFSNVKDSLSYEWTSVECNSSWPCPGPENLWSKRKLFPSYSDAEPFLGLLDTVFMFSYAIGLYISGILGDRYELRKVLSAGMVLSAVLMFIFGVLTQWLHFYNKVFYGFMWCLQGFAQSVGWPTTVAVVGYWFGKSGRGLLFGVWSSCASVGNIIGNAISAAVVDEGYEYAFLCVSSMLLGGGIIVFFGLVNSPSEIGLPDPIEEEEDSVTEGNESVNLSTDTLVVEEDNHASESDQILEANTDKDKPMSFFQAVLLPGVIPYSLGYACLKLVNYAFFFWLPYYLTNNFGWSDSTSAGISTWYDVGGIIGGIGFGLLSDWLGSRSLILFLMLSASPFALWGYKSSPSSIVTNSVLMALVGLLINGASNIVSAAVTADLGKQRAIGSNSKALATVTGIIDGTGSVGAAIGQYLVAVIQRSGGWDWVFNFFIIVNILCLICISPVFVHELKTYRCSRWVVRKVRTCFGHDSIYARMEPTSPSN